MKVHELIEYLRQRDPNSEVEIETVDLGIFSDEILTVVDITQDDDGRTILYLGESGVPVARQG